MRSSSAIVVRYAETDRMGIVHHSVYPVWYEVARTEYTKTLGMTYSQMEAMGVMTPIIEIKSRYRRPCTYEDVLRVEVWVSQLTPAKIEFSYEIFKEGEEGPINTGSTLHAWVGAGLRPLNLKRKYPELYAAIERTME